MTTAELQDLTREVTGQDCPELRSSKLVFWMIGGRVFQRDGVSWAEWPPESSPAGPAP